MTNRFLVLLFILVFMCLGACSNDDGPATATLEIETIGLEKLTSGSHYQGWLLVNGVKVPTEKFTDTSVDLRVLQSDLEAATAFSITIEPVGDNDNEPSAAVILEGAFNGNSAQLAFESVVADLSDTSGTFFLATPSDAVNDNDQFGVWFMKSNNTAGLVLPALANGWKYEGWVDFGNKILSTGTFTEVSGMDDGNFYSSAEGTIPPFPGEDFLIIPTQIPLTGIQFPADVRGKEIFITVEPYQDQDPEPFFIQPLRATASVNTGAENAVDMISDTSIPSGQVTRPN